MSRISPPRAIVVAVVGAALAGGLAVAVPSAASAAPSPTPSAESGENKTDGQGDEAKRKERAEKLCKRLPEVEKRVADRLARLTGDAETKGSVANLKARAEKARAEGDEERAKRLDQVATVRDERIDVLEAKKPLLVDARAFCEEQGLLEAS